MIKKLHTGTVKNGKLVPDDPALFCKAFYQHEGGRVNVTVEKYTKKRTTQQNRYLNGVVYEIIADWSDNTRDDIHEAMKSMFLVPKEICGVVVAGSTTGLTTAEFNDYVEKIRAWATQQGVYIPNANEVEYE